MGDETTKIKVNGKLFNYTDPSSVDKLFPAEVVLKYDLTDWYKLEADDKMTFVKNFIEGTYRPELAERAKRRDAVNKKIADSGMKLPDTDFIIENLQPCRVVGDTRKEAGFRFLNRADGTITDYDYHSIYFALCRDLEEKTVKRYIQNIAHVTIEYNPYEKYTIKLVEDSNNLYSINKFRAASWRELLEDINPHYDEDIKKLIEHLLPVEGDRLFVFNWIYHSLTSRAGTYLYLNGGQGSGKNTFAVLMAKLHGDHNSSNPKQDSLRNRFNQYLKEKRFIFFDEFNCRGRQDKDILKTIINDRIQIEGKGKSHEDIEIFASYVIANNSPEAIGLDPIDRRFSVPDITHDNIIERYDRKWIQSLIKKMDDDCIIAAFAKYVLTTYEEPFYSSEEPYQGSRFEEIVIATARLGIAETLNKVLKGEQTEYDYFDEKEEFTRTHKGQRYPSIQDWQKFFRDIRVGGKPIGEIKGKMLHPIEKYSAESNDEDSL